MLKAQLLVGPENPSQEEMLILGPALNGLPGATYMNHAGRASCGPEAPAPVC